jgi:hypothetical protein
MKKSILLLGIVLLVVVFSANAQKVATKAVDNKGTISWVLDSSTAVITMADSTILYVTPSQLQNSQGSFVKYSDTASMLANYINGALNGVTKVGQNVKLGGELIEPTTIQTTAANFLAITGLQAGSTNDSVMVVDPTSGQIKFVSASALFNALTYVNGLTKTGNTVKLGGLLTESTTIGTDATNTLKITGLQSGNTQTDSLVVVGADGTLKKVTAASNLQSGSEEFVCGLGQTQFIVAGIPSVVSKVWVYRNGVKLVVNTDYTVTATGINLSGAMGALVTIDDVIEVQWVK